MFSTTSNPNQSAFRAVGCRRLSLEMLAARDRADGFEGLPRGSAKPFTYLSAFQEALPYLGLPAKTGDLIAWLVKKTMPHDWEIGSRPIAWPQVREVSEYLQLSPSRVKSLTRVLCEAGVMVMRDDPQGHRWGRRGSDKRIIEAYGYDLSPLALRYDEFVRLAAEARIERDKCRALRKRKTLARRAIMQAGEALTALGPMPDGWGALLAETRELIASHPDRSDELALIVKSLEARQVIAEDWLRQAAPEPVNTDPSGPENEPLNTTTNLTSNLKDTVIAQQESSRPQTPPPASPDGLAATASSTESGDPHAKISGLTPAALIELAPRLETYLRPSRVPDWHDTIDAATWLSGELKISRPLWEEACRVLGHRRAAIAVALVAARPDGYFVKGAAHYFAGMIKKAQRDGSLNLIGSIWALRQRLWNAPGSKAVN